jgi:hypothetical protein
MASVAITVDGVLRKMVGGAPIPVGLELYHALATTFRVVLLSNELADSTGMENFITANQLFDHVRIMSVDSVSAVLIQPVLRVQQVNMARADGQNVQLVVEASPKCSSALVAAGYNVLTFTDALYAVPAWRPDFDATPEVNITPWDTLSKTVAETARLHAIDLKARQNEGSEAF